MLAPISDSTPVIVAALRTPIGRAHGEKGIYRHVRSDELMTGLVRELLNRTKIDPLRVEDVLLGCAHQSGEQGGNVARLVALMAGLPVTTAGATVNRWCGSSLEALHNAAHAIIAADKDVQIVGGLEHMQHLPMEQNIDVHPSLFTRTSKAALHMGLTAEFLAQSQKIDRVSQDKYALQSHQRAAQACHENKFQAELVPTWGHDEAGERVLMARDQCVRADTSLEKLSTLPPVFLPEHGTVTAGNSSPKNDGAAALLLMSHATAKSLGYTQLVAVRASAVVGVEPSLMGTGPIAAINKLAARTKVNAADVELIEINEAFAAQAIACVRGLNLDEARVNVHGGAIALGHPLGASGARIVTTLVHAMHARRARLGLAAMCVGLGQGIATLFERLD